MKYGWEYKQIKDVGKVVTGNTPSTSDKQNYASNDVCFVKPSDIGQGGITDILETEFHISEYAYNNSNRKLPRGSVLVTCIGIIGKVGILTKEATCNQQINAVIPNGSITSRFLAYCLCSIRKLLQDKANAPVVPILNKGQFSSFQIPVPPLSVQEDICSHLDKLSLVIEKKKEQLKELDNLAQSIFYDMFGDPVTNEKGWETKTLCEVGEIIAGSTPSTNDSENWDGDVNWVTPAELDKQLFYGSTQRKLTQKGSRGLTIMPVGTVLLSSRAPIGKLAITTEPMCCNQGFKNVICNDCLNNIFLYHYLLYTMEKVQALGVGATFKEVSKKAISRYMTILPPLTLQQSFAEKIEAIEHQKELINQSIQEVQTLFDSRMDYYFGD